jgi:hypothetical protein
MARGKRTGGPKTQAGKIASSKNALKTGAYSATVILPGEQEEQFRELESSFINDFRPVDTAEASMVHDLAVLTWKKLRLDKLEQRVILEKLNRPITIFETKHSKLLSQYSFETYQQHYKDLSEEQIESYKKSYKYAQTLHQKIVMVHKDVEFIESDHPYLLETIQELIDEHSLTNPTIENVIRLEVWIESEKVSFLKHCLKTFIQEAQPIIWYAEYRTQIEEEIQMIKDQRLLALMGVHTAARARDDLSREFYRTLTELRKHQAWRQRQQLIDITPKDE